MGKKYDVCPKCGFENVTESAWCEKCLTFFDDPGATKTLVCPECRHENPYVNDYCEECNEPLKPGQWE
jgi:ribosomal protein L40E